MSETELDKLNVHAAILTEKLRGITKVTQVCNIILNYCKENELSSDDFEYFPKWKVKVIQKE